MNPAMPIDAPPDGSFVRDQASRWLGLVLPDACIEGVASNLKLLAEHGAIVRSVFAELDRPI